MHNDDNNIEFHEYFPTPTTITQNFIYILYLNMNIQRYILVKTYKYINAIIAFVLMFVCLFVCVSMYVFVVVCESQYDYEVDMNFKS